MSDHALFIVAPFVSIVALVVAAPLRALYTNSEIVRPMRSFEAARLGNVRHPLTAIGFLGVLVGHLVIVAWPDQLLMWSRDLSRLMAFELTFLALGAAACAGVVAATGRRVLRRTADGASLVDTAFLGVLFLTLVSGLGVAVVYRWAAVWSAVTVTHYVRSLFSLEPNVGPLEAMPYLVKLHIFSSFIVMGLLAFTPVIGVLLRDLLRPTSVVTGRFVSIFDRQWRLLQEWALRSGRKLMWPEEED